MKQKGRPPKERRQIASELFSFRAREEFAQRIRSFVGVVDDEVTATLLHLLEKGMDATDNELHRGSRLSVLIASKVKNLSLTRQYDLLAIVDALIQREIYDKTNEQATHEPANPPIPVIAVHPKPRGESKPP